MIKVIAFDFGGVLGPDADDWKHTFNEISKLTDLTELYLQKNFNKHWPELKVGTETMKQFWIEVSKKSPKQVNPKILRNKYNNAIWVDKKLLTIIEKLNKKYKIVMIANDSDDIYLVKIHKFKLNKRFDRLYCSSQLKLSKPNPGIFQLALNDLDINPEELLLIDNQKNNLEAAREMGIKTILFTKTDKLNASFSQFSV